MKSYNTVMYPLDLSKNEFWLGDVDETGTITGFTNLILENRLLRLLAGPNMLYYVTVTEHGASIEVEVVQWYMAFPKKEMEHMSVTEMVSRGLLDTIETANKIMQSHAKRKKRPT